MSELSVALIIVSFVLLILAFSSQINVIVNEEIKNIMKKASDAYCNMFVDFEMILFILGLALSVFYTISILTKLAFSGRLVFFLKSIIKENKFIIRMSIFTVIFTIQIILSFYTLYFAYIVSVIFIVFTILLFYVLDKKEVCS